MTRTEAIDLIQAKLATLADERIKVLAKLAQAGEAPCVYTSLPANEKAAIETALDELDVAKAYRGTPSGRTLTRKSKKPAYEPIHRAERRALCVFGTRLKIVATDSARFRNSVLYYNYSQTISESAQRPGVHARSPSI